MYLVILNSLIEITILIRLFPKLISILVKKIMNVLVELKWTKTNKKEKVNIIEEVKWHVNLFNF